MTTRRVVIVRNSDGDIVFVVDIHGATGADIDAFVRAVGALNLTIDWLTATYTSTIDDVVGIAEEAA